LRASLARNLQIIIGRPNTREFIRIVQDGLLPNCPITKDDILAAEYIFGPDLGSLKGKTVRKSQTPVRPGLVSFPLEIMGRYKRLTLCVDVMFVNKIPFLVTISRKLKFGTAEMILNRTAKTIMTAIKNVQVIYQARGFIIDIMIMDGEFESMRGDLAEMNIMLNATAADEHVSDVERYIRTVKERCRCIYNTLPFTRMPARLIIEMVYYSVFWLNCFPIRDGVSHNLSPRTIVTGFQIDYNKHCVLQFGSYVQTHEEHDNTMLSRTTGAIALRPTGNIQGGYYFMSLTTGRRISRYNWTVLPMPQDVINRVHMMAQQQLANDGLVFLDRLGNENNDETGIDIDDPDYDYDDDDYIDNADDNHDDNNNDDNNNENNNYDNTD
jgi:hypothetical protein